MSAMQFGKTDINIQNKIHTMKMTKNKLAKGFTLVELLVVIAIIAALAALSTPVVLKQQKKASLAQAVNNAKQIGYLFKDFEDAYGAYPGTAAEYGLAASATSNEVFEKFYDAGFYDGDEEIFYAKATFTKKPDGDEAGTARCAAGEVGFGYSTNVANGLSSSDNAGLPLIFTPQTAVAATTFDSNAFGGSMVYLEIGGAVKTLPISAVAATAGQALVTRAGASANLMLAANTDWTGSGTPTVVPPIPK